MTTTAPAVPVGGTTLPLPGAGLGVSNVTGAPRIAEKTFELTACAQFGRLFGVDMVWFGLTQAQERQHGFDAATNLGGRAFILQFKASSTVPHSGAHARQRRFGCQHQQMDQLVQTFGTVPNSCFYFLPNIGLFAELVRIKGDVLGHSYLVDIAGLPNPVPATHRKNGYHYAYLDATAPSVTITSKPFKAEHVLQAADWVRKVNANSCTLLPRSKELLPLAQKLSRATPRLADLFYRNAALVVLPAAE